ncbi:MAG: methyltransferase domain-containing protein [Tepidisphaeraceae bacterium]|jgi:SAM-dependent methyltransferase
MVRRIKGVVMPALDDFADVYEAMIDWPKRLANEGPFFRQLFQRCGAGRVTDVACGTGHHAAMFHSWGLSVEGSDLSQPMLHRARAAWGESQTLRWTLRGFDQPIGPPGSIDAAVCIGNSLALAPDAATAHQALRQMLTAVRPGGVAVVQVVNLWSIPDGPCLWQKTTRKTLPQGESLILKGVHRCSGRGFVELAVIRLADTSLRCQGVPFLGLEQGDLESAARDCGAAEVNFFGGYQGEAYEEHRSGDLIIVAQKS